MSRPRKSARRAPTKSAAPAQAQLPAQRTLAQELALATLARELRGLTSDELEALDPPTLERFWLVAQDPTHPEIEALARRRIGELAAGLIAGDMGCVREVLSLVIGPGRTP